MSTPRKYTLGAQLAEAKRQLAMMRRIYPEMIAAHPEILDQSSADIDVEAMAAVVETLAWLEKNAGAVKRAALTPPAPSDDADDMTPTQARRYALEECLAIAGNHHALNVAAGITALINEPPVQKKVAAHG